LCAFPVGRPHLPTHALAWHTYKVFGVPPELLHKLPLLQLPEGAEEENVIVGAEPPDPIVIVGFPLPATLICGFEVLLTGGVPPPVAPP
jgi:hypothetical protein